jgi:hypothetical protein
MRKWLLIGLAAIIVMALGIQLIPYGHNHANPQVVSEPAWSIPEVRDLAKRACFDCHSNETVWPWYSNVAPLSWLAQWDVDQGRQELNFSEWDSRSGNTDEVVESVQEGEMPPWFYKMIHSSARLTPAEINQLTQEFQ